MERSQEKVELRAGWSEKFHYQRIGSSIVDNVKDLMDSHLSVINERSRTTCRKQII